MFLSTSETVLHLVYCFFRVAKATEQPKIKHRMAVFMVINEASLILGKKIITATNGAPHATSWQLLLIGPLHIQTGVRKASPPI